MYLHFRFLSVRTVGFIDFGYSLKFHPSQRVPAPVAPAWNMPNSIQRDTDKKRGVANGKDSVILFWYWRSKGHRDYRCISCYSPNRYTLYVSMTNQWLIWRHHNDQFTKYVWRKMLEQERQRRAGQKGVRAALCAALIMLIASLHCQTLSSNHLPLRGGITFTSSRVWNAKKSVDSTCTTCPMPR